jgi:hypothetical protein
MAGSPPPSSNGHAARIVLTVTTAVAAAVPQLVNWKWLSSLAAAIVGAAGLWFNLTAHRRAAAAEARATAADARAAEAHAWERAEHEKKELLQEAHRPFVQWAEAMRVQHGSGTWFPIEGPEWEVAHAAARSGLAEVDDRLAAHKLGRARIF